MVCSISHFPHFSGQKADCLGLDGPLMLKMQFDDFLKMVVDVVVYHFGKHHLKSLINFQDYNLDNSV